MTRPVKIALILGTAIAIAGIAIVWSRKKECNTRLDLVADEGYETAHDILFPNSSRKGRRLHFGPVHDI